MVEISESSFHFSNFYHLHRVDRVGGHRAGKAGGVHSYREGGLATVAAEKLSPYVAELKKKNLRKKEFALLLNCNKKKYIRNFFKTSNTFLVGL